MTNAEREAGARFRAAQTNRDLRYFDGLTRGQYLRGQTAAMQLFQEKHFGADDVEDEADATIRGLVRSGIIPDDPALLIRHRALLLERLTRK